MSTVAPNTYPRVELANILDDVSMNPDALTRQNLENSINSPSIPGPSSRSALPVLQLNDYSVMEPRKSSIASFWWNI